MDYLALIIFLLTYAGVALGGIPGLALDRTGIALLGAIAMVVTEVLPTSAALASIDASTILLLYALMILSAQFRLAGFYTRVALRICDLLNRPRRFLLILMLVSAALSAVLANDIVCLAFTPVLAVALLRSGLNPIPFLVGLAAASNIGSAATIIGNPQNMLIGQVAHLHFARFFLWCAVPSALSLAAAYLIILRLNRRGFGGAPAQAGPAAHDWPEFDFHQSRKGVIAAVILMALFFTPVPRELSAIAVAGVLLCSRRLRSGTILGLVDWQLITLFCGLFIVIRGIEITGLPAAAVARLAGAGIDIHNLNILTVLACLVSNVVSNVPAVMLFTKFLDPARPTEWYVLALASTFAGNLLTIGSIANLITIEQASRYGIRITFRDHARLGIPITAASIGITLLWVWVRT